MVLLLEHVGRAKGSEMSTSTTVSSPRHTMQSSVRLEGTNMILHGWCNPVTLSRVSFGINTSLYFCDAFVRG